MSPKAFKEARENSDKNFVTSICDKPYFPNLVANATSLISVAEIASQIVFHKHTPPSDFSVQNLTVTRVSGGITNVLYKVSNYPDLPYSSVLVRIFGAEGMIDRDIETSAYASLCDAKIAHQYLGRFANGRLEGWLEGYSPLQTHQLSSINSESDLIRRNIAQQIANLHSNFEIPNDLQPYFSLEKPGMWDQLFSWFQQANESVNSQTFKDGNTAVEHAKSLFLSDSFHVETELHWLQENVVPNTAEVAFCHNDILAANIMMKQKGDDDLHIQLIDFEYGGTNFAAFDIANHFNEYAGGTEDGVPDYSLFPSEEKQFAFIKTYLEQRKKFGSDGDINAKVEDEAVQIMMEEVRGFVLANHLYWGLWAVNQAAAEGCDEFDYLLYAKNRFKRYQETK